jgi:dsDNA-specific endonuclease/ATPase MutS2
MTDEKDLHEDEPIVVPLSDELDLHPFAAREVASIVSDWLDDCAAAGFAHVRIVHGKGVGVQAEIVRGVLARHPAIASFAQDGGNWGATVAQLRSPSTKRP